MNEGPKIKGNPLKISVYLLVVCYFLGEFVFPKYHLIYAINLIGIIGSDYNQQTRYEKFTLFEIL